MSCNRTLKCHRRSISRQTNTPTLARPRTKSEDEWLVQSPGVAVAYELLEAGEISAEELQLIIARDKLFHTGERDKENNETLNPLYGVTEFIESHNNEDRYDIIAQVTDEDFSLGMALVCYDPLTLEELGDEDDVFVFRGFTRYNIESLFNYIYQTKNYVDPTTRLQYTDDELFEISRIYKDSLGLVQPICNLVTIKHSTLNQQIIEQNKIRASALDGIENILDNIVSDIRDCVQGATLVPHCTASQMSRSLKLVGSLYPQFDHNITQLKMLDEPQTRSCLKIYLAQIQGHSLRPTKDPYGLLEGVLDHFQNWLNQLEDQRTGDSPNDVATL